MTDWWPWVVTVFAAVSYVGWGITLVAWRLERERWERHRCAVEVAPVQAELFAAEATG